MLMACADFNIARLFFLERLMRGKMTYHYSTQITGEEKDYEKENVS